MKRVAWTLVVGALVAIAGMAGWWAGRVALEPPTDPLGAAGPVTYTVASGSVGRSLRFTAVAAWDLSPVGRNAATGVVTSIDMSAGDEVAAGDVLYSVNLRPVVAAEGTVPSFRVLSQSATGPDVAQLQSLLIDQGFFHGRPDGSFGRTTTTAVQAWQRSLGIDATGVVQPGDVVFVPKLPARLTLGAMVVRGARLNGGEEAVLVVSEMPEFRVPLAVEQRALIPLSAKVLVTYPEGVWDARIERAVENTTNGRLDLVLAGVDGGSVCGVDCGRWVRLGDRTDFQVEIVVVPETSGPVVPVGAISTDPGNRPFVTLPDGTRVDVEIVESANGLAVVSGVEPGTVVLLGSAGGG